MLHTVYQTRIFLLLSLALASVSLAACGTLEVGLEPDASSEERSAVLEKSVVQTGTSGITQRMMTPTPVPRPVAIAFIREHDVGCGPQKRARLYHSPAGARQTIAL